MLYDDKFKGKYTKTDSGQQAFAGWTPEGMNKFVEYQNSNVLARENPDRRQLTLEIERHVLEAVRVIHGRQAQNLEAERAANRRQREANAPEVQVIALLDYDEE